MIIDVKAASSMVCSLYTKYARHRFSLVQFITAYFIGPRFFSSNSILSLLDADSMSGSLHCSRSSEMAHRVLVFSFGSSLLLFYGFPLVFVLVQRTAHHERPHEFFPVLPFPFSLFLFPFTHPSSFRFCSLTPGFPLLQLPTSATSSST
jgi:hypothetical protein